MSLIRDLGGLGVRLKMRQSVGALQGLRVLRALEESLSVPAPLYGLRTSRALWVSDTVMRGFHFVYLIAWVESRQQKVFSVSCRVPSATLSTGFQGVHVQ